MNSDNSHEQQTSKLTSQQLQNICDQQNALTFKDPRFRTSTKGNQMGKPYDRHLTKQSNNNKRRKTGINEYVEIDQLQEQLEIQSELVDNLKNQIKLLKKQNKDYDTNVNNLLEELNENNEIVLKLEEENGKLKEYNRHLKISNRLLKEQNKKLTKSHDEKKQLLIECNNLMMQHCMEGIVGRFCSNEQHVRATYAQAMNGVIDIRALIEMIEIRHNIKRDESSQEPSQGPYDVLSELRATENFLYGMELSEDEMPKAENLPITSQELRDGIPGTYGDLDAAEEELSEIEEKPTPFKLDRTEWNKRIEEQRKAKTAIVESKISSSSDSMDDIVGMTTALFLNSQEVHPEEYDPNFYEEPSSDEY